MYDLDTIKTMNTIGAAPTTYASMRIYDLGDGKFALGNKGKRAIWVVRRIANKRDALGRGLPTYRGVQARKPIIPQDARLVPRDEAGRLLKSALGLDN